MTSRLMERDHIKFREKNFNSWLVVGVVYVTINQPMVGKENELVYQIQTVVCLYIRVMYLFVRRGSE